MFKRAMAYIENGAWEEGIKRFCRYLDWACWAVIIAAVLCLGSVCWKIFAIGR